MFPVDKVAKYYVCSRSNRINGSV